MWLLAATAAISAQDWAVGTFRVSFGASQTLSIFDAAEQLVWQSLPSESFVAAAKSNDKVVGCSTIKRRDADRCSGSAVNASSQPTSSSLVLSGGFESPCDTLRWLALQQEDGGEPALNFSLSLVSDGSESVVRDRVFLVYGRGEGERFYGFGQQYSHLDAADSIVPIFSREGGIGRGLEPITAALNAGGRGVGGNDRTTYSATPLYMTSELRSLHLTSPEPAEFDLRSKASRGRVSIELSATRMTGRLMRGASALELLSRVTAFTGRQRPLPAWAHAGAVVGIQGGTARVLNLTARLLAANASVAGVWLQDWAGAYAQTILNMTQMRLRWNWVLDRQLYPEWEAMVASLSARGVRTYTYVNSFLQNLTASLGNDSRYGPAYERGVLLLGPDNATTVDVASGPGLHAGLLDLSTARGRDFAREMVAEMIGVGSSGWMADFGEYLPLDSTPRSSNGATFEHNRYPLQWQQANAAAVAAVAAGEDAPVWFARSSALTSPGVVPLFWLGDQMPSWDGDDGLASTITAMLSSGVSGHALTHSDTGGYTTVVFARYTRSAELLQRWTELNTFTAFLRSHEGSAPAPNAQPYDEGASLAAFARSSRLFASLAPYRTELMEEAAARGWPLVRPTWLHHEDDAATLDLDRQFLMGADLLVAPVLAAGASTVRAYLPRGLWRRAFNGSVHNSTGEWLQAEAPLGKPAAWARLDPASREPRPSLVPFLQLASEADF